MIIIQNIRSLDGSIFSMGISNRTIINIESQSHIMDPRTEALSLEQFAQVGADTPDSGEHIHVDAECALIVPAAVDIHVHSRDPGFTHKEDWASLTKAAYKGGVVALADMPNTNPPTMFIDQVQQKSEIARQTGLDYKIMLGVGKNNIGEIGKLLQDDSLPIGGLKVYYGQSTGELMYCDLEKLADSLPKGGGGKLLVFHSEDQCRIDRLSNKLSSQIGRVETPASFDVHSQVRDSASAWNSTKTILEWARRHNLAIHIAHISTPAEMKLIEDCRKQGQRITCEVAPHHLLLSRGDYEALGSRIKVNPPVRSYDETIQLGQYFRDGAIDCFATDHAPHRLDEKNATYENCPSGMPSIEYFWPLYLKAVKKNNASAKNLINMLSRNPARMIGFDHLGGIEVGLAASFVWLKEQEFYPEDKEVVSKCAWTPYINTKLTHRVAATWHNGICKYIDKF